MGYGAAKGIGCCGLVCALCSVKDCAGCADDGCPDAQTCAPRRCAGKKGFDGCWNCADFPCDAPMLQRRRNQAFIRYVQLYGKDDLLERLRRNAVRGVIYHNPGTYEGDYDAPGSIPGILRLIRYGTADAYARCPEIETEHFLLRLVREADAEDLLRCYSDPAAQRFFNADNFTYGNAADTEERMLETIRMWLAEYRSRAFVRFSIVEKGSGAAVGTVEMFADADQSGILRLDLCSDREEFALLQELYRLCCEEFPLLFGARLILTKAFPGARTQVLTALRFAPSARKPGYMVMCDRNA